MKSSQNSHGGDDDEDGMWINQLSTHLPDQVVYVDHGKVLPFQNTLQGILMFLDISGFTALCEKYSMNTKNGTDQLTKTLNGYMEALVHEVIKYDGDILKFAGDAILTLWRVDAFSSMRPSLHHVICGAMSIQRKYGEWTTNVGVKLRVKIGIAAGEVNVAYLGNSEFCHYVTMGRAVEAVNLAEKFCVSGDTVVSPTAWCHCAGLPIDHEVLDDGKHIKILGVEEYSDGLQQYQMIRTKEVTESEAELLCANIELLGNNSESAASVVADNKRHSLSEDASGANKQRFKTTATATLAVVGMQKRKMSKMSTSCRVRKAVTDESISDFINQKLALYVAPPVLKKIEEKQPLAYLSEMRQVTILFMNLLLEQCSKYELCFTMQTAFNIIYARVKKMQGCMNKIFMFDKGSTFLVIFGLPGFKHENDCGHALQCAYHLKNELDALDKVRRTSIGVTTGSTFCGVVGHNHRHEYTVIGRKVNMAARLMMYYPDKVTCDSETYHHSKITKGNFIHLELKEMKGLSNVGQIREYHPCSSPKDNIEALIAQELEYPIIGRDKEMQIFTTEMRQFLSSPAKGSQRQVILYEGEVGIGKTKITEAIAAVAYKKQIRVVTCTLSMQDAKLPYYAVKSLITDFLGFNLEQTHQEREQLLFHTFSDPFIIENMAMLNDILHLKLACKGTTNSMNEKERADILNKVLFQMVRELATKKGLIIFIIDDAHYMDTESWHFIKALGNDLQSLVILTMRQPYKTLCPVANQVLTDHATLRVHVSGIDSSAMAALACQLLGAKEIPERLNGILLEKSNGVPSWCEQLLTEMVCNGDLKIVPTHLAKVTEPMVQPDPSILGGTLSDTPSEDGSRIKLKEAICIMTNDSPIGVPDSIKGMIQARIDRMKESDQLLIKNASILGMNFPRVMLKAVVYPSLTEEGLRKSTQRMAEAGILICASKWKSGCTQASILRESNKGEKNTCVCPDESGVVVERKLADCPYMRFQSGSTQETAYQMYLESTKKVLHGKAAKFLESKQHKCSSCGGEGYLLGMISDLDHFRSTPLGAKSRAKVETDIERSNKEGAQKKQAMVQETNLGVVRTFRPVNTGTEGSGNTRRLSKAVENFMSERPAITQRRVSNVRDWIPQINSDSSASVAASLNFDVSMTGLNTALQESRKSDASTIEAENEVDLRECDCAMILSKVYPLMVHHWRASGNIGKTIQYLMEAAGACIATFNHMRAISYLREASDIMEALKQGKNPFEGELAVVDSYQYNSLEEARLESMLGQAHFHNGSIRQSLPHFTKALKFLECTLPTSKMGIIFELTREYFQQWKHTRFPSRYLGKSTGWEKINLVDQARNLSYVLHHYLTEQKKNMAFLVVLKQINAAEKSDSDFHELIVAYTSMIEMSQFMNNPERGQLYEYKAHARAIEDSSNLSMDDQFTLAHLYCVSLNSRLVWGRLTEAIESGYQCYRLSSKLHNNDMNIQVLPILCQALFKANRLTDAVDMMKQLEYYQNETEDIIAKAWYYACCLDALLELGFQIEPYSKCIEFAQNARKDATFATAKLPLFYLACCVTLWYQRKSEFSCMELWRQLALDNMPKSIDNFLAANGFVKILECKIILLSNCMSKQSGTRNKKLVHMLKKEVKTDMELLRKACVKMPVFKVRHLHLKAYHNEILNSHLIAKASLTKCISQSEKDGNLLEKHWATHSQQVWYGPNSEKRQNDFWLDHAEDNKQMPDWHLADKIEGSVTKFSLPLPHWFDA